MNTNDSVRNKKYEYLVTCPGHLCQVLNPVLMQLCLFLKAQATKRSAKTSYVSLFSDLDISTYLIQYFKGSKKVYRLLYV